MGAPLVPVKTGEIFGRLTAVSDAFLEGRYKFVLVRCECGMRKKVEHSSLKKGRSKSCGCLSAELTQQRSITHGMRDSPVYAIWAAMVQRCGNPNNKQYPDYGARGIVVAPEWGTFEGFIKDMGEPPFEGASIDREDNNLGYCKDNCRWATRAEQNRNTRRNVWYEYAGKRLLLGDWAVMLGLPEGALRQRLTTYKWPIEKAFTTPVNGKSPNPIDTHQPGQGERHV